jgi:hypothetical protein
MELGNAVRGLAKMAEEEMDEYRALASICQRRSMGKNG